MSHHQSSDGDGATTDIQRDEKHHEPNTSVRHVEATFDIDSEDLPKGYFLRPRFIGTLLASGFSVSAVSSLINSRSLLISRQGVGGFALAAPLLATINADIGPDPNYAWIGIVYPLTLAIGQALVGRMSDLFGRRWFFISGSVIALVGCIISAVAKNIPTLIGGTALIGFASASQLSYPFVLGELIPFKHRFLSMSFVYVWAVPFSGLGPAISYAFLQHTSHTWRTCYYLMIAINIAAVLCWFLL